MVQKDQIKGLLRGDGRQCAVKVACGHNIDLFLTEPQLQGVTEKIVVIGNQNTHVHSSILLVPQYGGFGRPYKCFAIQWF